MNDSKSYELEGVKEVIDALNALDTKNLVNIIRSVERKALNQHIVKPVKAAIPQNSLKKAIGVVKDKNEKLGYYGGVKVGKRQTPERPPDGVILRWIDKGTKERTTKKGAYRGKITGNKRIQSISSNNTDNVVKFFNKDFGSEVDKILERKLKRIKK